MALDDTIRTLKSTVIRRVVAIATMALCGGKSPENPRSPESHRKIQGRHRKTQDHRQLSIHGSPWSNNVACRDGLKVQTPPTDADVMFPLRLGVPDCWMGRLAR